MGRLQPEFLSRVEAFCDRALDVAEHVQLQRRSRQIVEQFVGCGSSVGANVFEADEAMSRPDFCKCLGVAIKELLIALHTEADELKRVLGAILAKSREPTTDD